jgi:uncharacterized protein YjdB
MQGTTKLGRLLAASMMTTVLIASLISTASADVKTDPPARPEPNRGESRVAAVDVCAGAHVQSIGWQREVCGAAGTVVVVGTTGRSLRMEALSLSVGGSRFCVNAHVQNIGWQGLVCADGFGYVTVGTTRQSLRMEAVAVSVNSGRVCANAHVQNIGWQGEVCGSNGRVVVVGTTGQGLRMEALALRVS